jgi:hypothetical protein
VQATASYVYDISIPTVSITTPISGGYINNAEDDSALAIAGTTSGVENGQTVTVNVGGTDYTTTVSNNTFTISVPSANLKALSEGTVNITANVSDLAGNPAVQATASYVYDISAPTATVNAIAGDNMISADEALTTLNITGATSGAENGQSVTVSFVDGNGGIIDEISDKTYIGTVNTNAWSVTVPQTDVAALISNEYGYKARIIATDAAGNTSETFSNLIAVAETSEGQDGYIYGATVFVDANNDGILNAGEFSASTNAVGILR